MNWFFNFINRINNANEDKEGQKIAGGKIEIVGEMNTPGCHKSGVSIGKIKIIATQKKKIRNIAAAKVSVKTFIGGHEITDTGYRIGEIGFEKVAKGKQPERIDKKDGSAW